MKYNVGLTKKERSYKELLECWEGKKSIPGNEDSISEEDYEIIKKMVNNIVNYYYDVFELDDYASKNDGFDCEISVDFCGGFGSVDDFMEEVSSIESNASEGDIYRFFNAKYNGDYSGKTELFDKNEIMNLNEDDNYVWSCILYKYIKDQAKDCKEKVLSEYTKTVENRLDEMRNHTHQDNDKLMKRAEEEFDKIKDSKEDFLGEYIGGKINLFYPKICLQAKIDCVLNGKDEKRFKWGLFEATLAHEMFHFFHDCCFKVEGRIFTEDNVYLAHMQECLAEFFSGKYMESNYRVTDINDYKYSWREGAYDSFNPGTEETDGGYSGSSLLAGYLMAFAKDETAKQNMKDNKLYKSIFSQSLTLDKAEEACNLIQTWDE